MINLTEILTEAGLDEISEKDVIECVSRSNGERVWIGKVDTYFPNPVLLTQKEMEEYIDFWTEEDRTKEREAVAKGIYDAAEEIDQEIIERLYQCL